MKQYLENLIRVVNNEDWKKLKKIELKTSKLKDMLHLLLDSRTKGIPSNRAIQNQLKIDDKLFRKMKSVLLVKCYATLAPEGSIKLLDMLSRYRLYDHYIRELEKQEKAIKKKPLSEQHLFYEYAFQGLHRLPYSLTSTDQLRNYGDKYLKTVDSKELYEQTLIIQIKIFTYKVMYRFFEMRKVGGPDYLLNELLETGDTLKKKSTVTLEALFHLAAGMYYYYARTDYSQSLSYFLKAKEIFNSEAVHLKYEERESIEVFIALNYYQTEKYSEALNILTEAERNFSTIIKTQTHVINRMIELHLIQDNLKEAKSLLDNRMKRFLDINEYDSAEMASLSYMKYYLLKDDLNSAFVYLDKSRKFLNKKIFVTHEIELRFLEIIYFLYNSDYAFADVLTKRGIKHLNEKSKNIKAKLYLEKFKVIQQVCKATDKDNPPEQKIYDEINQKFNGYSYLTGKLLLKGYILKMKKIADRGY